MHLKQKTEILIIGAGPTGLTLALILQKLGIDYLLIDNKSGTSTTSKAIGLQARVSEVFYWLDIYKVFRANASTENYQINFYNFDKHFFTLDLRHANETIVRKSGKNAFVPHALIIPQSETETILEKELNKNGGKVIWNTEFLECNQQDVFINSKLGLIDNTIVNIDCRFLVSCEGAHSIVRKQTGFSFKGKTYPMRFLIIDALIEWSLSHNQVHVWFHKEGSFSAIPLPGNIWRIFIEVNHHETETTFTTESLHKLMDERTHYFTAKIIDILWQSDFKINSRMVSDFRTGRIFLAGDAAHIHSPTGGQGITTGVQDAYNLGWKLFQYLRYKAPDSLLDTYNEERNPVAKKVLKATEQNTKVFIGSNKFDRLVRDKFFLPILSSKRIQRSLLMNLTQLNFHYRNSSLSINKCSFFNSTKIKAGDRTPDITFKFNHSQQTFQLFDLYKKIKPVILLVLCCTSENITKTICSEEVKKIVHYFKTQPFDLYFIIPHFWSDMPDEENVLVDIFSDLKKIYGNKNNATYVLRPDGYVGFYQDRIKFEGLKTYFNYLIKD